MVTMLNDLAPKHWRLAARIALFTVVSQLVIPAGAVAQDHQSTPQTQSPIQHVIVIIGENRSFDHVYATYTPVSGDTVSNLLSKGIVNADGSNGPNYSLAAQYHAVDTTQYSISPQGKQVYTNIPPELTDGAPKVASDTSPAPFQTLQVAEWAEPNLPNNYFQYLLTGATGLPSDSFDSRILNNLHLGQGVFQLTPGVSYDDYAASPVHRFYQMWQQADCNVTYATSDNPSGCVSDLFPWVETTIGAGSNGNPIRRGPNFSVTGEGSTAMAFYNVQQGDAPYMKQLADQYTLSDNFHQSVMGGTGANHIMFGFADAIWYSDGNGNPLTPPTNQIENPDPQPGTNNWYDQDGYSGGSYSNCADVTQPGVSSVVNYLQSLPAPVDPRCAANSYYLLNNYNPGYNGDGTLASQYSPFTIPPTSVRQIGDALLSANIPWKYYGEGWDLYVTDPTGANTYDRYCNICNPFQYATSIMTNPALREEHINDVPNLYEDIATNNLPAVSIVKPSGFTDGHPASSKLDLFEGFTQRIVDQVQANPTLWANTAIFITFDEGGGYYDSGYIQPVDFFGDGTRIPLLIVSPYSMGGHINHSYSDHVSIIKFIERNWSLTPLTNRSRDNFPNPITASNNPYVPLNSPALDDLFDAFNFGGGHPALNVATAPQNTGIVSRGGN
jgi:phospholipase C